jgi:hypothetical protein
MSIKEEERDQEHSLYISNLGMLTYSRYNSAFSAPCHACFPAYFLDDYDDKALLKNENALGINI